MARPRVKHPRYGWGTVREILAVFLEDDGRLEAGDVAALVHFDDQHRLEDPTHAVLDASMAVEGVARFAAMVRAAMPALETPYRDLRPGARVWDGSLEAVRVVTYHERAGNGWITVGFDHGPVVDRPAAQTVPVLLEPQS